MTTYLGKSCSFGLPRVPFVNCRQFMYFSYFPFGFAGRMWDLIVSVPDHFLSFYFTQTKLRVCSIVWGPQVTCLSCLWKILKRLYVFYFHLFLWRLSLFFPWLIILIILICTPNHQEWEYVSSQPIVWGPCRVYTISLCQIPNNYIR